MPYRITIYDNFHYMDPDEISDGGTFARADEALARCRAIVDDYLRAAMNPGMSANSLYENYTMFGEDPAIVAINAPRVAFSAWSYAREQATKMCAEVAMGESA